MTTQVSTESSLNELLQELQNQLKSGQANLDDFKRAYSALQKAKQEFQELLQWAVEQKKNEKEFDSLYRQVAGLSASELVERLKKTGFALKRDSYLKDAFDRQGYRILELVRAGRRDDAFHAILRIFVSAEKEFPSQLVEAFKPVYSDDLFKVFLFSFLSGILGQERENE